MQPQGTKKLGTYLRRPATLRQIAEHAGVSYSLMSKVSRGARRPNDRIKQAVEEVLHVPWREVFPEVSEDD